MYQLDEQQYHLIGADSWATVRGPPPQRSHELNWRVWRGVVEWWSTVAGHKERPNTV
jgi:hypothetical protein